MENIKKQMLKPSKLPVEGFLLCDYKKIRDYVLVTVPSITLDEQMRVHPIVLAKKKKMIITWGEEDEQSHSKIIKTTIRRLRRSGRRARSEFIFGN